MGTFHNIFMNPDPHGFVTRLRYWMGNVSIFKENDLYLNKFSELFSLDRLSCSLDGKSVLANGTKERDVLCGPASSDFFPRTTSATIPAPARDPGS